MHKVLIIEDSETMSQFYMGLLAQFNCSIDTATTYEQAKVYIMEEQYDVFIIDIRLSGEHKGTDLIGKGSASPNKCIISSGNLPEDTVKELVDFYNIKRERIMIKPPDTKKFVELVERMFQCAENDNSSDSENPVEEECIEVGDECIGDRRKADRRKDAVTINYREILKDLKRLSFSQWVAIGSVLVALSGSLSTYFTYRGYQERSEYKEKLYKYADDRFEYYKVGDKITARTYVEKMFSSEGVEYTVRLYPDGFIKFVAMSDKEEPVEYWIPGHKYRKEIDDKYTDKTLFEILKATWMKD